MRPGRWRMRRRSRAPSAPASVARGVPRRQRRVPVLRRAGRPRDHRSDRHQRGGHPDPADRAARRSAAELRRESGDADMSKMKIALFALIGLLVAVGGGWLWGVVGAVGGGAAGAGRGTPRPARRGPRVAAVGARGPVRDQLREGEPRPRAGQAGDERGRGTAGRGRPNRRGGVRARGAGQRAARPSSWPAQRRPDRQRAGGRGAGRARPGRRDRREASRCPMQSRDELLRAIREQAQHPASSRELMQLLAVPREQRAAFRRQLKALVADGPARRGARQALRPGRQDGPRRRPAADAGRTASAFVAARARRATGASPTSSSPRRT